MTTMVINRGSGAVLQGDSCACGCGGTCRAGHAGQTSTDQSVPGVDWLALTTAECQTLVEYAMARLRGQAEPPPIGEDPLVPFRGAESWYRLSEEARERLIDLTIAELRRAGAVRERPAAPRWLTAPRFAEPVSAWAAHDADGPDLIERPRGDVGIGARREEQALRTQIQVAKKKAKGAPVADRERWAAKVAALEKQLDDMLSARRVEKVERDFGQGDSPFGRPTGA